MQPPPKFVVHLGDIVHPVPSLPTFADAVGCFKDITAPVDVPIHLVAGNHDVGDKKVDWMPADQVCDSFLDVYRKAFGADYYAFDEGELRLIVVNSLLLNSGLADEERQRRWLEEELTRAANRRVFLFMHYPPYIHSSDERGNYDNIDEPARSWLLSLISKPQVEAVFAGHVHNFWYERIGRAELYMLPSTAFLRHDFTEFYKVAPAVEFGRGDVEKFGYFVVDVFPDGHVAYSIRTMGAMAEAGTRAIEPGQRFLAHPKTSSFDNVGVELRHPWAESMQITATGGVQEFGRKWARNDYPLLALLEMGVKLLKVPDIDLVEAASRQRMKLMSGIGHRFIVTTLGVPKNEALLTDPKGHGVTAFEVNLTLDAFTRQRSRLRDMRAGTGSSVYFAKIQTADDSHYDGKHFSHFIKSGFSLAELEQHRELLVAACEAKQIDGVTVRIDADESVLAAGRRLAAFHETTGCLVIASLKLSSSSLAVERADDTANVARVAQAMILSKASAGVRYVFDTFMDVDRGYFPRHAFIDRRFNPRSPAAAFTFLSSVLSHALSVELVGPPSDADDRLVFQVGSQQYALLCGPAHRVVDELMSMPSGRVAYDLCTARRIDVAGWAKSMNGSTGQAGEATQVTLVQIN